MSAPANALPSYFCHYLIFSHPLPRVECYLYYNNACVQLSIRQLGSIERLSLNCVKRGRYAGRASQCWVERRLSEVVMVGRIL